MSIPSLITIAQYSDALQAHLARGRLEVEGISVHIADEHYITMNWYMSQALGGVKLQVPEHQAEQAKKILARLAAGEFTIDATNEIDSYQRWVRCPRCQSHCVKQQSTRGWTLSSLYLFNLPFFFKPRYRCEQCRYQWKQLDAKR